MTADFNRVTEKPKVKNELWLVSAEWRGGHDRRVIRLDNIHSSEADAKADWNRLTAENHNAAYGKPVDYDAGFIRHPIRKFVEQPHESRGNRGGADDDAEAGGIDR